MLDALFRLSLWTLGRCSDDTLRALARMMLSRSWRRFEEATEHPREAQEGRLQQLVERAKDTAFGKEHGFAEIKSFEEYRRRVPIRGYDGIAPYIERMLRGEDNVLIPDRPMFFARSSGTTGTPKSIPVTPVYLSEFRMPRRVWARQVMQAFPGLLRGKILGVHSPRVEGQTAAGVPYGSITVAMSGSPQSTQLKPSRFSLDPTPRSVFLLEDFELKYRLTLRLAAQEDIRLVAAVNPSTIVLLAKKLDQHAELIADDLESGGSQDLAKLPPELKAQVSQRLTKDPAAAERIRASKKRHGRVIPTEVWPQIEGLISWKGGSAPFYLAQLADWFPNKAIMDYGYLATEGGFSIPLSPDGASGVVAVNGHVLEFIPEGKDEPALLADELVIGQRYRVIVSGSHGLYRYDINDVVECTGRYRNTAQISFVHKGGNMLSMTGEKIGERHVVEAFASVAARTGFKLAGFSVSVELRDPPRYVFAVEAERPLDAEAEKEILHAAESALREVNLEYAAKRDSLRLGPPALCLLSGGAYERFRRAKVSAGAPDSHVKPPHLLKEKKDIDALGVVKQIEADG